MDFDSENTQVFKLTWYAMDVMNNDKTFTPNGCGSNWIQRKLCNFAQWMVNVDFSIVFVYHDAEYAINPKYKSEYHRTIADAYLEYNTRIVAGDNTRAIKVGKTLHTILTWAGKDAYNRNMT